MTTAVVAGGLMSAAGDPGGALAAPARPNVVVIQSDDQSLDMMRAMTKTKRLIGSPGATFMRNFTNWPICCPSRATQLTGQYAHNHGVLGNKPPLGSYTAFDREDNLAVWLNDAGYRVGHVGRFLNGYGGPDSPDTPYNDALEVPPGWTEWRTGRRNSQFYFYNFQQNVWNDSGDPGDPREGELVNYGAAADDYRTDVDTLRATRLVNRYAAGNSPFYLQVDYVAPHAGPGDSRRRPDDCTRSAKPAPRHAKAFDGIGLAAARDPAFNESNISDKPPSIRARRRLDDRMIARIRQRYECRLESTLAIDDGVGKIVNALRRSGELANTYVFYTSDNGFFHGEHRIPGSKGRVYEQAIHVPLLMRGPGIQAGVKVRDLTSNADFAPTVMQLAAAAPTGDRQPDGLSLLPSGSKPWRETGRELLIETNTYTAVRTQRYKWVEYGDEKNGFQELYDLRRDPAELVNVASRPKYAEVADLLADRLAGLRSCAGETCRLTPQLEASYHRQPAARRCLTVSVDGDDVDAIRLLSVEVNGKRAGEDATAPFRVPIAIRQSGHARNATVTPRAELADGRRVSWQRKTRYCR